MSPIPSDTDPDTDPEIEKMLIEGYRRMPPHLELERVVSLNRALDQLALARIQATYGPDISERELQLRLAALSLGRETMIKVFDWDLDVEGY